MSDGGPRPRHVDPMPDATPGGYRLVWPIKDEVTGAEYEVLLYPDDTYRFGHVCDRGERGVIRCAPLLQTDNGGHRIESKSPLTIAPSILCSDCGTHGFIREGRWVS